jgi:hypothetical protein
MLSRPDRIRPVPDVVATEIDVIHVVDAIVLRSSDETPDKAGVLSKSGLLAISLPAAFGGADISNAVVADAVSRLAAWHLETAQLFIRHLTCLELLRTCGTVEQRRLIYSRIGLGDIVSVREIQEPLPEVHLAQSGLSFEIRRCPRDSREEGLSADWSVILAREPGKREVVSLVSAGVVCGQEDGAPKTEVNVSPDNVLGLGPHAIVLAELMRGLLEGAACRGRFDLLPEAHRTKAEIEYELLDAIVLKAAGIIDGIQVNQIAIDVQQVRRLSQTLIAACSRFRSAVADSQ